MADPGPPTSRRIALDTALARQGGRIDAVVYINVSESELLDRLKRAFGSVKHIKPPASRAQSAELYVLATKFRGP